MMIGVEKEILILVSKIRCITESQVGRFFGTRKRFTRKPFKKTLRKMCNEYTLRKYPCNINYSGYRDNSYIYYLNGSKMYKGKELVKVVIGSELAVKLESGGYKVRRFYRNVKVDNSTYDLYIEYVDNYNDIKQILVDINLGENFNIFKYANIEEKIEKSTIPFFEVPKILVITKNNKDISISNKLDIDIDFVDTSLSKLFKII
ncbi:MAG TPA: hypothetical protein K8V90_06170 [Romboutsia timonensis]|uniref:Uncharacterized protein n=1 Tax=Romboutsia timonensis TaxID=1776391 RepID=A0A921T013_9FIRM|nr:hypothetical protein [uncultured Romboutsia sp.]HJG96670.1 hypothetical protein [Romboutsia timonensis]